MGVQAVIHLATVKICPPYWVKFCVLMWIHLPQGLTMEFQSTILLQATRWVTGKKSTLMAFETLGDSASIQSEGSFGSLTWVNQQEKKSMLSRGVRTTAGT